jgi:hypothetical protein
MNFLGHGCQYQIRNHPGNEGGAQGVWYGDVSADTIGDIETNNWNGVEDVVKGYNDLKAQGSDFKVPDGSNAASPILLS